MFIASLPCCACGVGGFSQAAHIRHKSAGMGMKPSDSLCVPLCCERPGIEGCHCKQHTFGEVKFWQQFGGIDKAKDLAQYLFLVTGNEEKAREYLVRWRR